MPLGPLTQKALEYVESKGERVTWGKVSPTWALPFSARHQISKSAGLPIGYITQGTHTWKPDGKCLIAMDGVGEDSAVAWALLHEFGHHVLDHIGVLPFGEDNYQRELAATAYATMLGRRLGIPESHFDVISAMSAAQSALGEEK